MTASRIAKGAQKRIYMGEIRVSALMPIKNKLNLQSFS